MAASLTWDGVPEFSQAILAMMEGAHSAARNIVTKGLHSAQGKIQERAREGGRHAPGTPTPATKGGGPAVIHGDLGRSIQVGEIHAFGVVGFEGKVGPTTAYGRRVELDYGYPYTAPGMRDAIPSIRSIAGREWSRGTAGHRARVS